MRSLIREPEFLSHQNGTQVRVFSILCRDQSLGTARVSPPSAPVRQALHRGGRLGGGALHPRGPQGGRAGATGGGQRSPALSTDSSMPAPPPLLLQEIAEAAWFAIDTLPIARGEKGANRFWQLKDFLPRLRQWVAQVRVGASAGSSPAGKQKKRGKKAQAQQLRQVEPLAAPRDEPDTAGIPQYDRGHTPAGRKSQQAGAGLLGSAALAPAGGGAMFDVEGEDLLLSSALEDSAATTLRGGRAAMAAALADPSKRW